MRIATQTSYLGQLLGDVDAVKLLAKVGYGGIDYSMFYMDSSMCPLNGKDYMNHVKQVKKAADECKVPFTAGHAFFPFHRINDDTFNENAYVYTLRSIEIASFLGIEYLTMHPSEFEENQEKKNLEFFTSLVPYLKEHGVKILIENLFTSKKGELCSTPEALNECVDVLNKNGEYFAALVDIGHAEYAGCAADEFIRKIGKERLKGLHIQDSDRVRDLHQLPFLHKFDWEKITMALGEIDYTGDLTFEADKFLRLFPSEMVEDASRFMLKVGEQLARMVERCRK